MNKTRQIVCISLLIVGVVIIYYSPVFSRPEHSFSGNQGQGVGNPGAGNRGQGVGNTTAGNQGAGSGLAGRAGGNSSVGSPTGASQGRAVGSAPGASISPDQQSNNLSPADLPGSVLKAPQSVDDDADMSPPDLPGSVLIRVPSEADDEGYKMVKPPLSDDVLDEVVNTDDVSEVKSAKKIDSGIRLRKKASQESSNTSGAESDGSSSESESN